MDTRERCVICGEAVLGTEWPFCPRHRGDYEIRQRAGVPTAGLDSRWLDTLATWRERPAALDGQAEPQHFRFRRTRAGWLLFVRGRREGLPDWIAVRRDGGAIRRFADCPEWEVWEDLQTDRARARQEGSVHGGLEGIGDGDPLQAGLGGLVRAAPIPIYGLEGRPLDLQLASVATSLDRHRLAAVSLTFSSVRAGVCEHMCHFTSIEARHLARLFTRQTREEQLKTAVIALLEESGREEGNGGLSEAMDPIHHVLLPQLSLVGEIFYWPDMAAGWAFHAAAETVVLHGAGFGVEAQEVPHLLSHLIDIRERPEIVRRYQAEMTRWQAA